MVFTLVTVILTIFYEKPFPEKNITFFFHSIGGVIQSYILLVTIL